MMKRYLLAGATLAVFADPISVAAQDGSWTGPYVGARLGYTSQSADNDETILFDTDLNGSFDDTVNLVSGANAFSRGFCGGAASTATANGCRDRNWHRVGRSCWLRLSARRLLRRGSSRGIWPISD
jgi:outer membrane immunogenic protein